MTAAMESVQVPSSSRGEAHSHPRSPSLDFTLPPELEAGEPAEVRGAGRDDVRLMVSWAIADRVAHARFRDILDYLAPGDVLVINTSGTMNASLPAIRDDGRPAELHLSTLLPGSIWTVEVRQPVGELTQPVHDLRPGETLALPAGGSALLHAPYDCGCDRPASGPARLWMATLSLSEPTPAYLERYGSPIRYGYVRQGWPISYYQTVYATETGSAEMPSAGRAFTPELITRLVASGIQVVPLLLHTGVASLESHEPPYEEFYRVPAETARIVNVARAAGKRVVAVGTTVVRALETAADETGVVHPSEGWTCTVVSPQSGVRSVDGLLTGLHEPRSSHLMMLEAFAGDRHLEHVYREALQRRYLWHEFGDLHLLLP